MIHVGCTSTCDDTTPVNPNPPCTVNGPDEVCAGSSNDYTGPAGLISKEHVRQQPMGKLFNTITNGIRKMPGYADQISPEDRWAIALYLKALQRTRNATPHDLPSEEIAKLRELN